MPDDATNDLDHILTAAAGGDATAAEKLFPIVYAELHRIAAAYMKRERPEHTFQPTALVHEAFLRLAGQDSAGVKYQNHRHFIATAAVAMRRILVNHAKAKQTEKRGGGRHAIELDEATAAFDQRSIDLLALDEALDLLAESDPTQARLVELRFFGGLSVEQCAEVLEVSQRTVIYEWAYARAWLRGRLEGA